jgi:hypothetical protein
VRGVDDDTAPIQEHPTETFLDSMHP